MRKMHQKTRELLLAIERLNKEEGLGLVGIGARLGRHPSTISGLVRRHKVPYIRLTWMHEDTPKTIYMIKYLLGQGLNLTEVCVRLGKPRHFIDYYVYRYGIPHGKRGMLGTTALRYLKLYREKSGAEIARELGVSRQRIHQLRRYFRVRSTPEGGGSE